MAGLAAITTGDLWAGSSHTTLCPVATRSRTLTVQALVGTASKHGWLQAVIAQVPCHSRSPQCNAASCILLHALPSKQARPVPNHTMLGGEMSARLTSCSVSIAYTSTCRSRTTVSLQIPQRIGVGLCGYWLAPQLPQLYLTLLSSTARMVDCSDCSQSTALLVVFSKRSLRGDRSACSPAHCRTLSCCPNQHQVCMHARPSLQQATHLLRQQLQSLCRTASLQACKCSIQRYQPPRVPAVCSFDSLSSAEVRQHT